MGCVGVAQGADDFFFLTVSEMPPARQPSCPHMSLPVCVPHGCASAHVTSHVHCTLYRQVPACTWYLTGHVLCVALCFAFPYPTVAKEADPWATAHRLCVAHEKIPPAKGWKHYQLGDVVRGKIGNPNYLYKYRQKYPGSIATAYIDLSSNKRVPRRQALRRAVAMHDPTLVPDRDVLVVHLRVGDVVEWTPYEAGQFLQSQRSYMSPPGPKGEVRDWGTYVRPASFFEVAVRHYKGRVRMVVLVAGGFGGLGRKSRDYVCYVGRIFRRGGYQVGILPPDDDFAYMARAWHLLVGGGGFAGLVKSLVDNSGKGQSYSPVPCGEQWCHGGK